MGSRDTNGINTDTGKSGQGEGPGGEHHIGAPEIWTRTRGDMATRVTRDDYARYIKDIRFIAEVEGSVVLATKSRYMFDRVDGEHKRLIQRLWKAHDPRKRQVRLICWATQGGEFSDLVDDPWSVTESPDDAGQAPSAESPVGRDRDDQSFDTLVVGASNEKAAHLMRHIAEGGEMPARLVLLHGRQGTGKTHLLTALQQAVDTGNSGRRVVFMSAEEFQTEFVSGAIERDTRALKMRVRSGDLLLIDDLQWIANAPGTDREFFASLRAVTAHGGLVVLTADAAPGELTGFSPRLKSELKGGASVEIGLPDEDMRRAIVRMHAGLHRRKAPDFLIDDDMVERICRRVRGPGRELTGVLASLYMEAGIGQHAPTLEMLDRVIRSHEGEQRPPTLDLIKRATTQVYAISKTDLTGPCKAQNVTYPRQLAMYLCRDMTPKSYPQIGNAFGGRDHATVIHAVRKVKRLLSEKPETAGDLEALREAIFDLQAN
ncbi:MAG: ATP-binding protein [Alphaproteobacteria bacterium]|nr:ATP-binding protein [Alphaproteobacteria bacterium]